jgi:hypothetical protein
VFVYARFDDGHIWELWFPDVRNLATRQWGDVSVHSGFGSVAGAPVVVQTNSTPPALSLIVRKATTNRTYTLDWADETGWETTRVHQSDSSTAVVITSNTISARGSSDGSPGAFTARGWDGTNDGIGWYGYRSVVDDSHTRISSSDIAHDGTSFMAMPGTWTGTKYWVEKFGNELRQREIPWVAWGSFKSCYVSGSPRGATMLEPWTNAYSLYARGGVTPDVTNDLLYVDANNRWSCKSYGGAVYSAVTVVEHGTEDYFLNNALYKGPSSKLYYFDWSAGTHANLGLTLP